MSKFVFKNQSNNPVKHQPIEEAYCQHCKSFVFLSMAGIHLQLCRPEVYKAIEKEYDIKEAHALVIAS